ncbi:hypothetical protein C4D34_05080 [Clostridium perfringens]
MCMFCFLDSYKQHHIREGIQLRTDRFEHSLDKYKLYFLNAFKEKSSEDLCDKHDNESNNELLTYLKTIKISEIRNFFDELEVVYIKWIDALPGEALNRFKNLLNTYDILDIKSYIDNKISFRGRQSKSLLSHWDMFHIPFNKRYLIGNQRYSIMGQPILYLASSPLCVFEELHYTENIKLSSYRMKQRTNFFEKSLTLFNNTCNLLNFVKIKDSSFLADNLNYVIDQPIKIDEKNIKQYFFQYIIANCCSFKRSSAKRNYAFCEEYVLPQILAQIVKEDGSDGIVFNSTLCYTEEFLCENSKIYNLLCKNFCIFTKYSYYDTQDVTYVYDKDLYKKFIISSPYSCDFSDVKVDYHEINKSLSLIGSLMSRLSSLKTDDYLYYAPILSEMMTYLIYYTDIINNINKSEKISEERKKTINYLIILHTLLLRNIILNIRDEFNIKEESSWR